ncbi:2-methoxy-6-polyprenyl-1,4-benzoquinol methylase, mitochondrial [Platysternon megacephalum]|uniref:2-methoxy-6-polyprenyl-1,4-benzoquinol methylase, mitochondrial n=1 Tax=Platysternon megacephalum TaxID=55544 RepID=A0A4D9DWP1_9SAUR|nr:2-methoxy-6-polyprenyl-1,4-benzoquinol methylase, mitochondrial [Platysternon megacephalum]
MKHNEDMLASLGECNQLHSTGYDLCMSIPECSEVMLVDLGFNDKDQSEEKGEALDSGGSDSGHEAVRWN